MAAIINALWGIFFFCLVAICKAVADTLAHHFDTSIFKAWGKFWDPAAPTKPLPFSHYPFNAWHIVNSIAIALAVVGAKLYKPFLPNGFWWGAGEVCMYGGLWILVFNFFYDKILRVK